MIVDCKYMVTSTLIYLLHIVFAIIIVLAGNKEQGPGLKSINMSEYKARAGHCTLSLVWRYNGPL